MTPKFLSEAGTALWGPGFKIDMAIALGVNERTVRRWLDGSEAMPFGAVMDLQQVVRGRKDSIEWVLDNWP